MSNNIREYVNEKEEAFMQQYTAKTVSEVLEGLGISSTTLYIDDLNDLPKLLSKKFIHELLDDYKFLEANIISHFYKTSEETHIFGIGLINFQEPCECCGDCISEWYALSVSRSDICLGFYECHDFESVTDSSYSGNPLTNVKDLIESYNI